MVRVSHKLKNNSDYAKNNDTQNKPFFSILMMVDNILNRIASSAHNTPKFGNPIIYGVASRISMFVKNTIAHVINMHNSENRKYLADASSFF